MALKYAISSQLMKSLFPNNHLSKNKFSSFTKVVGNKPILSSCLPSVMPICEKKTIAEELGLPEPPKRPCTPFLRYCIEEGNSYPDLKLTERVSKLSKQWAQLDDYRKNKFLSEYTKECEDYQKMKQIYVQSLTSEQIQEIKELKLRRRHEKKERKFSLEVKNLNKEAEKLGKPKHPGNRYSIFAQSIKDKGEVPDKYNYMKYVAQKWQTLGDADKSYYEKESKMRLEKYRQDLSEWETKMEQMGRLDLVKKPVIKAVSSPKSKK